MSTPAFQRNFVLPDRNLTRVCFESDYEFRSTRVRIAEREILELANPQELDRGTTLTSVSLGGATLEVRRRMDGAIPIIDIFLAGESATPEDELSAYTARAAWIHAFQALAASAAGFVASAIYLSKSQDSGSLHEFKMAYHMAAWHLLLTLTLFPASVWGGCFGIRFVQTTSALFFLIHAGIAAANLSTFNSPEAADPAIALWNAVSGFFFLVATIYGNRAHAEAAAQR